MTTIERSSKEFLKFPSSLRVTMLGIRGFPNIQGGAENHAQNLSVRLAELGCDMEVIVRSPEGPAVLRSVPCRFVPLVGEEGF